MPIWEKGGDILSVLGWIRGCTYNKQVANRDIQALPKRWKKWIKRNGGYGEM